MKSIIRVAKLNDLEIVLKLNKALFDFEAKFNHNYNLDWTYSDAGKAYFKKRLESKLAIVLIAEIEEKPIGYILAFIDNYSYRSLNPICEIENMFVEERYRHQGIGNLLIDKVRIKAKGKRVKLLRVGAIAGNDIAINFYKSLGFKEVNLYLESRV